MNKFKPGDKVCINNGVVWEVGDAKGGDSMTVRRYPDGSHYYWTKPERWELVDSHFLMGGSDEYDEAMQAQAAMEGL